MNQSSFVAKVDVPISIFVRRASPEDFQMQPCVAGEVADIGVSHEGTQDTLLPGFAGTHIAAKAGTSCRTYGQGETCEIIAGAAINAGQKLKPDASGRAIPAAATDKYSAIANTTVAALGQKVSVTIQYGVA